MSKKSKQNLPADGESPRSGGNTEWFVQDRFGLFIHWGLYALGARHEWLMHRESIPVDVYEQRYFARFDESPAKKTMVNGSFVKEYWAEGSNRARNWQRYDLGGDDTRLVFEEGVDGYVPYAGKLRDNVTLTLSKIVATMCTCGALSIDELQKNARLTLVSSASIREGGAHDIILREKEAVHV